MKPLKIFIFLNLLGWILIPLSYGGDQQHQDALAKFIQAGLAYKEGDYDQAVGLYQDILSLGLESGEVYYNLGNTYFKDGDLARAILYYERARRLIPRDGDLISNFQYVLSLVKNLSIPDRDTFSQKILMGIIDQCTFEEVAIVIYVLFLLLGMTHLVSRYRDWPRKQTGILMAGILFFELSAIGFFISKEEVQKDWAIIIMEGDARYEPREEATTHFQTQKGWKVRMLSEEGAWVKIQREDGKVGWIKKETGERI